MCIPLFILAIVLFVSIRPSKDVLLSSYNSMPQTQAIKGFFVVTIFFSHFCSYIQFEQWYDKILQEYCQFLGQLMVAPFLFYSGYGIFESVKKKGLAYIKDFPKKRILKTLLHFDFAVILFLLLDFIIDRSVSIVEFLYALIAWESIGNSNWFVFAILCEYVFVFIGLAIFKANLKRILIFVFAMSLAYIALVSRLKGSYYWFDTVIAFPLGCFMSLYKVHLENLMRKRMFATGGAIISLLLFILAKTGFIPIYFLNTQLALVAFCSVIVFFSLHVRVNSSVLIWFGSFVFEIYILQRIPMNFLATIKLNEENIYMFFIISFVFTLCLSLIVSKWNNFFDRFVLEKVSKH